MNRGWIVVALIVGGTLGATMYEHWLARQLKRGVFDFHGRLWIVSSTPIPRGAR